MIVNEIFSSFFAVDTLDIDNQPIIDFCYSNITKNETNSGSLDLDQECFQSLLLQVKLRVDELHKQIGLSNNFEQYIWRYWANLNVTNDISAPHCHPESFFSCVYYAKAHGQKSGRFEFLTPVNQMLPVVQNKMIDTYTKYTSPTWWIDPEPGKLIIFPSWLWHFVNKNTSGEDRISIAIDTKVKIKQ